MNIAIVGIGSNINPEQNILEAIRIMREFMTVVKCSELVRTAPIGVTNQPDFINGAVKVLTPLDREELQQLLKKTEDQLGRDRSLPKFGPRTIDLDIIIWNGQIVHKDYYLREFIRNSVRELES